MQKRLTAQGPRDRKSYTVTLPIDWIKKERLDKTRSVELNIIGNKIIISSKEKSTQKITIDGRIYLDGLLKVLQGVYRAGINEIKLLYDDPHIAQNAIEIIEQKLIGYEVLEQKKDYIIIKDITKESEEDFMIIFRRIFILMLELSESKDTIHANSIDKNIKKLINYCQRILMTKGHAEFQKTPLYYLILDRLEKLKDEFIWLLDIVLKKSRPPQQLKQMNTLLRTAYELFYKFEPKKFDMNLDQTHKLRKRLKPEDKINIETIHLHNIARNMNSLYGDIFTLKMDQTTNQ